MAYSNEFSFKLSFLYYSCNTRTCTTFYFGADWCINLGSPFYDSANAHEVKWKSTGLEIRVGQLCFMSTKPPQSRIETLCLLIAINKEICQFHLISVSPKKAMVSYIKLGSNALICQRPASFISELLSELLPLLHTKQHPYSPTTPLLIPCVTAYLCYVAGYCFLNLRHSHFEAFILCLTIKLIGSKYHYKLSIELKTNIFLYSKLDFTGFRK